MKILALLVTIFALLMLCACEEDYDPSKECGIPPNCCWLDDNTGEQSCNDPSKYFCNENKPSPTHSNVGTCETMDGGTTTPPPTPDGGAEPAADQ
jgi:hypothetical protein